MENQLETRLETVHVREVYDQIAKKFQLSRAGYHWKGVKSFLDSLQPGESVADIGCGSGRNMVYRKDLKMIGCDFSQPLVEICRQQGLNVQVANAKNLPYGDNSFDAVMSIAVLHHLEKEQDRQQVVDECLRILKPGGKFMISVWANTQPTNKPKFVKFQSGMKGDYLINWEHQWQRYYHLFDGPELQQLCQSGLTECQLLFEYDNWIVTGIK